ncbi:MAG: bifunctional heptose 7-phosphate kinase/heptose 1-phosphate adenyltransferase [Limisphaerales bacterium]
MAPVDLRPARVRALLRRAGDTRILVVGDVMLDQFIWGDVRRISPEAPVPVVDFRRESFRPGGAATVARNLTALGGRAALFGAVGRDAAARQLADVLRADRVDVAGLLPVADRPTGLKTRVIAQHQHVVRVDRERRGPLPPAAARRLLDAVLAALPAADAVILGDYAKGVVTASLLEELQAACHARGVWLSLDPKPVNPVPLAGFSLLTPNRKEAFELAGLDDDTRADDPAKDAGLQRAADALFEKLSPALLLITLGDQGMLLCRRGERPFHIPTVAREVFDVSGAGDTVIASFTLAIAAGASPVEAAIFSNHAAGVVVAKVGTATVTPEELLNSFAGPQA